MATARQTLHPVQGLNLTPPALRLFTNQLTEGGGLMIWLSVSRAPPLWGCWRGQCESTETGEAQSKLAQIWHTEPVKVGQNEKW